jgi:ABC-type transport system involved in multi-copper enzyme maturation permease subunit
MSWPLIKYVLTAAVRDRLIVSILVLLLLATSLAVFMASAAVSEQDQFAAVFTGGALRLLGVLGLVLFSVFFIRRSFDSKDIEFVLSRPVSRVQFLLSYAAAFSMLAILVGLAEGLCLFALSLDRFGEGHMLWIASIIVENMIMVNMALFLSMVLSSAATAALVSLAFYVLARMMGQILGIIDVGTGLPLYEGLEYAMLMVSAITPRLDLMGQTSWLVYGYQPGSVGLGFVITQGLVFMGLVLTAAIVDLRLKQF